MIGTIGLVQFICVIVTMYFLRINGIVSLPVYIGVSVASFVIFVLTLMISYVRERREISSPAVRITRHRV